MTTTTLMNALGWTLIHFVWQGILIGVLLAVALVAGRGQRGVEASRYRYGVAFIALALVVLAPLVTFAWQLFDYPETAVQPANISLALAGLTDGPAAWQGIRETWLGYLLIAWFAGVAWGSIRLLVSWLSLYMVRHSGTCRAPAWLESDFRRLRQELRIHRPVNILISNIVRVPLTAGWMQPVILLPATALTGLQPEQIRLILRHELAHIQRYDYLVNWIQNLVQVMLFYHPVVHWIVRILNDERELCCDHEAIHNRCRPVDYAKILVKLQEANIASVPQPALAASGSKGGLYRRVQRLLNTEAEQIASHHDTSRSFAWVFTVMLSAMVTTIGILGSPEGHASYANLNNRSPIIHPLSELPAIVEQRTVQREEMIRHHQKTNFASFQWPSALAPVRQDTDQAASHEISTPSVPLSELRRQMMYSVKRQLPDDQQQPLFREPDDRTTVATANVDAVYDLSDVGVKAELLDLADLDIEEEKIQIPEPYVKVKPKYPRRMSGLMDNQIVDVAYSIGPDGRPVDMVVLSPDVHKDFVAAALSALEQWRFDPVSPRIQKLRISQRFNFLQVQTHINSKCSAITGGRLCPKLGSFIHRIQVNPPNQANT